MNPSENKLDLVLVLVDPTRFVGASLADRGLSEIRVSLT